METASPHETAASLVEMLNTKGQGDYIGEPISQLAHSLQAAHLARTNSDDEELIIAALLHDIGQFLPADEIKRLAHNVCEMDAQGGSVGRVGHERIGDAYLVRLGFSRRVGALVASHVPAKRYLCAVDPAYHATLSEASQASLRYQGGPMSGTELQEWAGNPWCTDMCRMRKWDDAAKVVGLDVPPAEAYLGMIERHLARENVEQ
ncbi:hypothetical protein BAUCODRAFT_309643 [Baudoinia panamericana UAMH 10762]|uniref:HD domain-containing protein n=1 Tax=Baudoinia panamericana (strain UAMH 10762) TaxID=717646 RepID=M2LD60_BAUPA|nr:uncharacterized protein BAUCODRAFT_309643 [Baudoinia panamericana UAMH 10762]EMC91892.1 hypothetical protein BAUCODRAFT_309643 [Baudoinia panamericana UAMH 10762]